MYSSGQKAAQLVLVWLIPIAGAVIVVILLMEEPSIEKRLPRGNSFIIRFLMLSFIFSSVTAASSDSNALDSGNVGDFDAGGGDGGGGE